MHFVIYFKPTWDVTSFHNFLLHSFVSLSLPPSPPFLSASPFYFPTLAGYNIKLLYKSNPVIDFSEGVCWCVWQWDAVVAGNKQDAHQIEKREVPPAVHSNWSAQFDRPLSCTSVGLEGPETLLICVRSFAGYFHFCPQLIILFLKHRCHSATPLVAAELVSGSADF